MSYEGILNAIERKGGKCLNANNLLPTSYKIWWFKCKEGHIWKDSPASLNKKEWCPFCAKKKIWDSKIIHLDVNEHIFEYIIENLQRKIEIDIINLLKSAVKP